jgi:deoxyadenosine/deoxycytidine kinase
MYILEGNIGAGKSTFLKLITQKISQISASLEPIDTWHNTIHGQSLLTNFYESPQRWAYTLETSTMLSRIKEHIHQQKHQTQNLIMERSIYSGHYCFARNSYESGFMSPLEWKIYIQTFDLLTQTKCKAPLGFIYVRTNPEIAYERVKKRNRDAEKTLSLNYLKMIHVRHEDFLIHHKKSILALKNTPVLILNCDEEFQTNETILAQHINAIQNFMHTTRQTFKPAVVDIQLLRETMNSY